MMNWSVKSIAACLLASVLGGTAGAQTTTNPLPLETQLVSTSTAPPPTVETFTIDTTNNPTGGNLTVTLTDLERPYELASANVVVTQAGAVVGSAQLAAPATTATATIPSASGAYTLYVFGAPGSTALFPAGTFSVCVAPATSSSNCIQSASLSGNITSQVSPQSPTVSTVNIPLTVTTAGAYTFTFADLAFPTALASAPNLALFQGSTIIQVPLTSGTPVTLSAGNYTLLGIAQADPTDQAGLYSLAVTDPSGNPFYNAVEPVGLITSAPVTTATASAACSANSPVVPFCSFDNPSAQSLTLTVTDFAFPAALSSASALLTSGSTVLGSASSAGGAQTFTAPAGALSLWTYGSPGSSAGTFSTDVSAGSTDLYTTAQGVNLVPSSGATTFAYAYVATVATAGSYEVAGADLQFPAQLTTFSFDAAQNGTLFKPAAGAPTSGSFAINAVAGNVILLATAQPPAAGTTGSSGAAASGLGLFDVNLQSSGTSSGFILDKTQSVNTATDGLFQVSPITIADTASYQATLTDLKFPAAFGSLALVVSQGANVLNKVYGGGNFTFTGDPGTYQLTFVATPGTVTSSSGTTSSVDFGLYSTSVVFAPVTVTLTASASSVATGSSVTLTWTAANATSCTASGGNFTGSVAATGGTQSVVVAATTAYSLTCTGAGGSATATANVTATPTQTTSSSGGGGSVDLAFLALGGLLAAWRVMKPSHAVHGREAARGHH